MGTEFLVLCIFGSILGLIPAAIANRKGHDFVLWWLFGALFFLIALIAAIIVRPKEKQVSGEYVGGSQERTCPYCAETIKKDAVICRFCNRDLPPLEPEPGKRFITDNERSSLTYRQKRVLSEYGYLLPREKAEEVGVMLGNFSDQKKILQFVMQHGEQIDMS